MRNSIYNADCMRILTRLAGDSVDALVTDPPYGTASKTKVQIHGEEIRAFDYAWDQDMPLDYIAECARILKPGASGFIFLDKKHITTIWNEVLKCDLKPMQSFYWIKKNTPPNIRKNFRSAVECALFFRKPGKILTWNGGGHTTNTFMTNGMPACEETILHPTQKPENLMKHLIGLVTKPDDLVLDPFMGSGSTGAAALKMGRRFIGVERDPSFYILASHRLHWIQEHEQVSLWNQKIEEAEHEPIDAIT